MKWYARIYYVNPDGSYLSSNSKVFYGNPLNIMPKVISTTIFMHAVSFKKNRDKYFSINGSKNIINVPSFMDIDPKFKYTKLTNGIHQISAFNEIKEVDYWIIYEKIETTDYILNKYLFDDVKYLKINDYKSSNNAFAKQ